MVRSHAGLVPRFPADRYDAADESIRDSQGQRHMASQFDPAMLIARVVGAAPFLLVAVVGVVLCLVRESRPVRVRIAAGCAVAIIVGLRLMTPYLFPYVFRLLPMGNTIGEINLAILLFTVMTSTVYAVALGLLLWGAFALDDRPPQASQIADQR